jgi:FkbM family methyltransferase
LPEPGRVVDLGAHIGTFTLYAAALGHEVAAVDASARNVALLRQSVAANAFRRVHVVHAAVSDAPGELRFTEFGPYGVVSTPLLDWPTVAVKAVTLDGLLDDLGWDGVDVVKMDIEGSEIAALRGMRNALSRERTRLILESNGHTLNLFGHSPGTLLEELCAAGYRTWQVRGRSLVPMEPSELQFECVVDYLALRNGSACPRGWRIGSRRAAAAQARLAAAACRDSNPCVRAHAARTLRLADAAMLSRASIRAALRSLAADPVPDVRADVAWFAAASRDR